MSMKRARIGILASGGGTNLQCMIDACERGEIDGDVAVVVSNVPEAFALTSVVCNRSRKNTFRRGEEAG